MLGLLGLASVTVNSVGPVARLPRARETNPPIEIIVTGERVPRSLQATASSVVVVTARGIEAQPVDRVEQLLETIPNVQLGSGTQGPTIRGQDSTGVVSELFAFLGGTRPRTTLTIDGRAVTYNEYVYGGASIWDVERVEVFRSPQTTTQGRNSIAGAIFVTTKDPSKDWEGRARAIIGEIGTRQLSAVVSGPIIDDQFAIRVAGDLKLGRNVSDMANGIVGASIDHDDFGVARIKLVAEPRALPGIRLETSYAHVESQAPQFQSVRAPFNERRNPVPERTDGVIRTKVDSVTAQLSYAVSPSLNSRTTLSHGIALVQRFGLPGLGRTRVDSIDNSAETILQWQPGRLIHMLGGLHYSTLKLRQFIDITGLRIGTGGFGDRQRSLGLFGEATWHPAPRLAITAGLRYQSDKQVRHGQVGPIVDGITVDYDGRFDAWLPKVSVAYDLADPTTIGLLAQRAYNPGGTTVNLATRLQNNFGPERLWNYEAFMRTSFAGRRGTVAANLFYNDITDAQRPQTIEFVAPNGQSFNTIEIANAPSARTAGLEVEVGWRASSRLSVRLGLGLLDTKVRRTLAMSDPLRGKAFQRSPNISASAAIDWNPNKAMHLSVDMNTRTGYFSDDANTLSRRINGWTTVNARTTYTAGSTSVFGYVRNAFDAFYLTSLSTPTLGAVGRPREFGLGIEGRF